MSVLQVLTLAVIQGFCELLPVSSSAHVILAEKLMGLDPSAPDMTLLLVMLHTGTMLAVILHFRKEWMSTYFSSPGAFRLNVGKLALATAATAVVGFGLLALIPIVLGVDRRAFEIEHLFGNTYVIAGGLFAAGSLTVWSGLKSQQREVSDGMSVPAALAVGAAQGLCLPFRGFSRSGATISTALLAGVSRRRAEQFSFALAVILTPPVIAREVYRLSHVAGASALNGPGWLAAAWLSVAGMAMSFIAGLVALRWLSRWLEHGRWHYFGVYCLVASFLVLVLRDGLVADRPTGLADRPAAHRET